MTGVVFHLCFSGSDEKTEIAPSPERRDKATDQEPLNLSCGKRPRSTVQQVVASGRIPGASHRGSGWKSHGILKVNFQALEKYWAFVVTVQNFLSLRKKRGF